MQKSFLIFAVFLIVSSYAQEAGKISFVFSDTNPPFSHEDELNGSVGLIPDLVEEVLLTLGNVPYEFFSYPWKRAQYQVETSHEDAFCTYPSSSRKLYALFTETPLLHLDYDYLIFSKNNERADDLLDIEEIDDLKNFIFVSHSATAWEEDNIPEGVERHFVNKHDQLFHITFGRGRGDFFIMNLEEAVYHAQILGYKDELMYKKVNFIPDSSIPFHIGVRRDLWGGEDLIKRIDSILQSDEFKGRKEEILQSYK